MIKSLVASKTAKLLAACVCPVAGTVALTTAVPQVRSAVHKATAPRQYAKPKTRVRPQVQTAAVQPPCVEPGVLDTQSIARLTPLDFEKKIPDDFKDIPKDVPPPPSIFPPPIVPPGGGTVVPPPGIVPEPGTWLQLVLGFGVIGMVMRARWGRVDEEDAGLDSEKA